jgi:hypothetical protein
MITRLTRRDFGKVAGTVALGASTINPELTPAQDASPDDHARITEQKMTVEERFPLLISVLGRNAFNPVRDKRIPGEVPMSAGYTPLRTAPRGSRTARNRCEPGYHQSRLSAWRHGHRPPRICDAERDLARA